MNLICSLAAFAAFMAIFAACVRGWLAGSVCVGFSWRVGSSPSHQFVSHLTNPVTASADIPPRPRTAPVRHPHPLDPLPARDRDVRPASTDAKFHARRIRRHGRFRLLRPFRNSSQHPGKQAPKPRLLRKKHSYRRGVATLLCLLLRRLRTTFGSFHDPADSFVPGEGAAPHGRGRSMPQAVAGRVLQLGWPVRIAAVPRQVTVSAHAPRTVADWSYHWELVAFAASRAENVGAGEWATGISCGLIEAMGRL